MRFCGRVSFVFILGRVSGGFRLRLRGRVVRNDGVGFVIAVFEIFSCGGFVRFRGGFRGRLGWRWSGYGLGWRSGVGRFKSRIIRLSVDRLDIEKDVCI